MNWIIAGGTGFLGTELSNYLTHLGYDVTVLTRQHREDHNGVHYVHWNHEDVETLTRLIDGCDVLVNLCGLSVDTRYTKANKQKLYASRIDPTRALGLASRKCTSPPPVVLQMSTATIYKDSTTNFWDEAGELGTGFSVDLATKWEEEAKLHFEETSRLVLLRTAIVLGRSGGAYPPLRQLSLFGFRGFGGRALKFSWIHVQDFCKAVVHCAKSNLHGPVNLAAQPTTVVEFMRNASQAQGGLSLLKMPEWMVQFGSILLQTEPELLLKSRNVLGRKLRYSGFEFRYPHIIDAVRDLEQPRTSGKSSVYRGYDWLSGEA
ncbi:MAG: DUF1731 domain-containing protein [Flavobacteriia bacterium]|nr:DUF1731 domain-containing protein [Flavobacteriia bacterium]